MGIPASWTLKRWGENVQTSLLPGCGPLQGRPGCGWSWDSYPSWVSTAVLRPQCWEGLSKAAVLFLKRQDEGYLSGRRALPMSAWAPAWGLTLTKKALGRKCQGLGGQLGLGGSPSATPDPASFPSLGSPRFSSGTLTAEAPTHSLLLSGFFLGLRPNSLPLLPVSRPGL